VRAFWLTLFAIGAAAVFAFGWQTGAPWTAAAFVVFFVSRVWRSVIKRPLFAAVDADPAGYLGAGACAAIAAVVGEGQEWLYVAPFFLFMGALQLALLSGRSDRQT
jgi:hypothetical protein